MTRVKLVPPSVGGNFHFVFLSYHRACSMRCALVLFYQTLAERTDARRLECQQQHEDFIEFEFHTHDLWTGENQDLFWARVADDLMGEILTISGRHLTLAAL